VTLLAAIAARSIAVPLSPAFPAAELQYIINQSEASLLVNSAKFAAKARDVLATELASRPAQLEIQKHASGAPHEKVMLENADPGAAAMMLYTSGTTNRPVSPARHTTGSHLLTTPRKASSSPSPS
jgi:malonyl-CoA/methylmalonyl-CoA synthetase